MTNLTLFELVVEATLRRVVDDTMPATHEEASEVENRRFGQIWLA